ncbi:IS66 family insertion sequence element accessory protein TnpB, partial [Bradyrhizobium sp. 143]|nr:IS66 family insertion sequence element accessory protein TnpB [Bradyrhizobium sp. 143]
MSKDSRKDSDTDRHAPILKDSADTLQRVEIITGTGRRRRWSADAKTAIVAESFAPGASVSAVARRHDISPSLLFLWRRQTTRAKVAERGYGERCHLALCRLRSPAAGVNCGRAKSRWQSRSRSARSHPCQGDGRPAGAVRGAGGSRDGWPMIGLRPGLSIWIATQPVDFRRGMDSLAMLVSEAFGADPFDGGLYIFRSKRRDRVKILTWDGSGLVLYYKRIEGQFTWPPIKEGVMPLSHAQLSVLLDGSDWKCVPMRVVDQP